MSQQINLFEGGLVKSRDRFSVSMVGAVYFLAAVVMYYLFTGLQAENAELQLQRNQAVAQYEAMQKKVEAFSKHVVPIDNSKLEAELNALNSRLEMQSQMLAIFQYSISDAAYHLIDYMRALTQQQQPGVWLTGFKIEPGAQHLSFSGKSLQTVDIPAYLGLLSAQKIFAGTLFSGIQFKQVELHKSQPSVALATEQAPVGTASAPEPAAPGKGGAAAPSVVPAPASPAVGNSVTPAPDTVLMVYAFDVKGQDMQNPTKAVNGVTWDEFVRQTTQAPASALPKKE